MRLFDGPADYQRFLELIGRAQRRTPVQLMAYCLMPNHFHLVMRPIVDGHLSQFMHWLSTKHTQAWQTAHECVGAGCVYQGRFKSIPVSSDAHFLRLCRYVERNPLRAGLVEAAETWPWSSLAQRGGLRRPVRLEEWPVSRPDAWVNTVNSEMPNSETEEIRASIRRGSPYGDQAWREQIGMRLGLMGTIRPIGRPKKMGSGLISGGN